MKITRLSSKRAWRKRRFRACVSVRFLMNFVKHDFEHGLGTKGRAFGMLITLQQRIEVELIDEFADAPHDMIGRKLLVDFFSNRRIDHQAIERKPWSNKNDWQASNDCQASENDCDFGLGACESLDHRLAWRMVCRWR